MRSWRSCPHEKGRKHVRPALSHLSGTVASSPEKPSGERGVMADQSISCPSCGRKIPLTRALRAEIEESVRQRFDETLRERERELRAAYEDRLQEDLQRAQKDAAKKAERKVAQDLAALRDQVKDQTKDLEEARRHELSMRKREREL